MGFRVGVQLIHANLLLVVAALGIETVVIVAPICFALTQPFNGADLQHFPLKVLPVGFEIALHSFVAMRALLELAHMLLNALANMDGLADIALTIF